MKFIVLAPIESTTADRDAAFMEVLGPHSATTIHALSRPEHPVNAGRVPSDADLHAEVALEIIAGAVPVIHPELSGPLLNDMLKLLEFLRRPVVRLEDLTELLLSSTTVGPEHMDAMNILPQLGRTTVSEAHASLLTLAPPAQHLSAHEEAEYLNTPRRTESALAATTQRVRKLGDRLRRLQALWLRWEQGANAFLGNILKNPMTGNRQQRTVRPYRLRTTPLETTG